MRLIALVVLLSLTAACQLALPGGTAGPGTAAVDEITVTPLDAPAGDAAVPVPAATERRADAPPPADTPPADPPPTDPPSAEAASADTASAPLAEAAEPEPEVPAPVKGPAQIDCERKGGRYAVAGKSGALTCVRPTRDGGKRCSRESDCEGLCLARSRTCAPIKPLFGCNDILQADGRRVTLCID